MKNSFLLATCIIAAVSCASLHAQASAGAGPHSANDTIPQEDRMFVSQAGAANMAEVAQGNLAIAQGQSAAVKDFGNRMVTDHTAANVALNNLAGPLGIALAQQPTEQQEQTIHSLQGMTGPEFDRHYARTAVKDHEDAVRLFTQEASFGADPRLRTFAAHMLPTLKQHLSMAHKLPGD